MQRLRLQQIPNQSFQITLDQVLYTINLRTINRYDMEITLADIYANGELLKSSVRCVPDEPLIPYNYLTQNGANFFWYCLHGDYPYYTNFNTTQVLCYGTKEELDKIWE